MKFKYLVAFVSISLPCLAFGQDARQCSFDDMQRRIEILREPGVSVPCEVHYYKDTEEPGSDQVLWSASSQAGYCEEKVDAFVAKLEGWGWDCGGATMPAPPTEPAPAEAPEPPAAPEEPADVAPVADDTDVLQPADGAE